MIHTDAGRGDGGSLGLGIAKRNDLCMIGAEDRKGVFEVERSRKCAGMRVTKWKTTFGRVYKRGGRGQKNSQWRRYAATKGRGSRYIVIIYEVSRAKQQKNGAMDTG
jgi:hypothetical protein